MLTNSTKRTLAAVRSGEKFILFNGDCCDLLADMPADSVDLIVSSPPYFMGKEYDRSADPADFEKEHAKIVPLLSRILRPGGSLCWQVGTHCARGVVIPLDILAYSAFSKDPAFVLRNRIVWHFEHGVHARNRFSGRHETVLWFSKGDGFTFNLDAVRVPQKYPGKRHYKGPKKGEFSGHPDGKNPGDVWQIPNVKAKHPEKTAHPCQFPVAIPQRLIRALSNEGGTVFDPFSGSATTGIAAALEGRRFIGCELEKEYAKISADRYTAWQQGTLAIRDWRRMSEQPDPRHAVSIIPEHFASSREARLGI